MDKSCLNCIYCNKKSECTLLSFSEGGPKLIPENRLDNYFCRSFIPKSSDKKVLKE